MLRIFQLLFRTLFGPAPRSTSPTSAHQLVRRGARLIDVREPAEVAELGIRGAVNIPLGQIQRLGPGALDRHGIAVREGETVLVMCRSGARSRMACVLLQQTLGDRVCNVAGGILAWQAARLPTVGARSGA